MKLRILVIVVALVAAIAVYLFLNRSNPVVYRYIDRASVQYSGFIIQNPFRDREPERRAEIVLHGLHSGDCQKALSLPALESARLASLCEREQKFHLGSWSLMDRKDNGQKIQFVYEIYRNSNGKSSLSPPAWVNVEKIRGQWQATDYQTYY